jgi:molybdate transport system substrate-binding protein
MLVLAATLAGLVVVGCRATSTVPRASSAELTVLGAASLRDALEAARTAYESETPGVRLTLGFDASSTLRAQIEQGAPGDLFLAADTRNPETLASEGRTVGAPVPFATNTIVIVTPPDDPAGIRDPFDLARPGVRIVVAGPEVPISVYADHVLEALAGLPGAPTGFLDAVAANVVSREDNVRAVAAKIELGEGDAALVYATDARGVDLRVVPVPQEAQVTAVYAAAILSGSTKPSAARAFLDWLVGPRGRAVMATAGFGPPP